MGSPDYWYLLPYVSVTEIIDKRDAKVQPFMFSVYISAIVLQIK